MPIDLECAHHSAESFQFRTFDCEMGSQLRSGQHFPSPPLSSRTVGFHASVRSNASNERGAGKRACIALVLGVDYPVIHRSCRFDTSLRGFLLGRRKQS